LWKETEDGHVNVDMVERLSVDELPIGGHPDDRFAVTAHLPSGASVTLSAHRDPDDARRAVRELIG
jgi:hypothetical protein